MNPTRDDRMAWGRRRSWRLLTFLGVAGVLWGAWAWWTHHRFQEAKAEIESEIVAGRHALASQKLNQLLAWKADPTGELHYLLGASELAQGRNKAAGDAWARVVPGSEFSARAIEGQMHVLLEAGQLAAAERLVNDDAQDPRNDRTALLVLLVPVFSKQGRITEAERLIEDRWENLNASGEGALEEAIKLVLQHVDLTLKPSKAADADRRLARYRELHERQQPYRDAVELARLAEELGRRFEARGFLTIALQEDPARDDLRQELLRLSASEPAGSPAESPAEEAARREAKREAIP